MLSLVIKWERCNVQHIISVKQRKKSIKFPTGIKPTCTCMHCKNLHRLVECSNWSLNYKSLVVRKAIYMYMTHMKLHITT